MSNTAVTQQDLSIDPADAVSVAENGEGPSVRLRKVRRMTPEQCRAARELLGWNFLVLARSAGVSNETVKNLERGKLRTKPSTVAAVQSALEAAGVEFIAENGGGLGVRLRDRSAQ